MAVSPDVARRWAQATVVVVLVVGGLFVAREASRPGSTSLGPSETTTTTKTVTERKTTPTGHESMERQEVTTAAKETVVERILGQPGLWLARILLVVLVAFLLGGVVQRILLGEFALKAGPVELPALPPAPAAAPIPETVTDAFRVEIEVVDVAPAADARATVPLSLSSSHVIALLEQIQGSGPSDYAVIDLGAGRSWLTTRLFLFAVLLRRMRALRTFVFVETRDDVPQRFIGIASPDVVNWRLAREYPWLDRAFAQAYAGLPAVEIHSEAGALDPGSAAQVVGAFMEHPEIRVTAPRPADTWEQLPTSTWEHARWINRTLLDRLFDLSPARTSVMDLGDLTARARTLAVLEAEGAFVALVDAHGTFQRLLDRQALLETVARRLVAARRSAETPAGPP